MRSDRVVACDRTGKSKGMPVPLCLSFAAVIMLAISVDGCCGVAAVFALSVLLCFAWKENSKLRRLLANGQQYTQPCSENEDDSEWVRVRTGADRVKQLRHRDWAAESRRLHLEVERLQRELVRARERAELPHEVFYTTSGRGRCFRHPECRHVQGPRNRLTPCEHCRQRFG